MKQNKNKSFLSLASEFQWCCFPLCCMSSRIQWGVTWWRLQASSRWSPSLGLTLWGAVFSAAGPSATGGLGQLHGITGHTLWTANIPSSLFCGLQMPSARFWEGCLREKSLFLLDKQLSLILTVVDERIEERKQNNCNYNKLIIMNFNIGIRFLFVWDLIISREVLHKQRKNKSHRACSNTTYHRKIIIKIEHVACHKGNKHGDNCVNSIRWGPITHEITLSINQIKIIFECYNGSTFKNCYNVVKYPSQQDKIIIFSKGMLTA